MDDPMKREIGIWLLIVLGAFGAVLIEHVRNLSWSAMWIWFIGIAWYASEGLGAYIIWYYFKVSKIDVPVVLTKVKSVPEDSSLIKNSPEVKLKADWNGETVKSPSK